MVNSTPRQDRESSRSPDTRFRELVLLALVLAAGPTVFAAIVLGLDLGTESVDAILLTPVWLAVAAITVAGAILVWRSRVHPLLPGLGAPARRGSVDTERLRTTLIILWAALEGQALFGVTAYYLSLDPLPLAGLPIAWVGILFSRPRREWFGR